MVLFFSPLLLNYIQYTGYELSDRESRFAIQAWGGINRVLCDDSHANITDGVWSKMHVPSVLRRVFSNYDVCPLIYGVCSLYGVILTLFKAKPVLSCIFIFLTFAETQERALLQHLNSF